MLYLQQSALVSVFKRIDFRPTLQTVAVENFANDNEVIGHNRRWYGCYIGQVFD